MLTITGTLRHMDTSIHSRALAEKNIHKTKKNEDNS